MTFHPSERTTLAQSDDDGVLTLAVRGELDADAERRVRAWVDEHAGAHDGPVALDLREVTFVDSGGLRALINADAAARRHDWSLRILVADGPVSDTLAVSGLGTMLPVYGSGDGDAG